MRIKSPKEWTNQPFGIFLPCKNFYFVIFRPFKILISVYYVVWNSQKLSYYHVIVIVYLLNVFILW